MINPLGADDRAVVDRADKASMLNVLTSFRAAARPDWLRPGHAHPDGGLPNDDNVVKALPAADVIELIAVCGPLHTFDGWSYFSRAILALLVGDPHLARHLAYYAELRAALSMLASSGIGVFNGVNRVAGANAVLHPLSRRPTHDMCWAVLQYWATLPESVRLMLNAIKINNVAQMDSLQVYFPSPSVQSLGGRLIGEWGFDLQQGAIDRAERNHSSYQPNELTPLYTHPDNDLDFVRGIWSCFQPRGWDLERHLLRRLLELELANLEDEPLGTRTESYVNLDPRVLSVVSADFLARRVEPDDHHLLTWAHDCQSPAPVYAMISRAAVLLRLSTAIVQSNFESAALAPFVDLQVWWRRFGVNRGFWTPPAVPEDMQDLWLEVEDALLGADAARAPHRHEWIRRMTSSPMRMAEAERVLLWTIC